MRIHSCFLTLIVLAGVSIYPALAEHDLEELNAAKFLACDQEKGSLLKSVDSLAKEKDSLAKEKATLEKSLEEVHSQLAAKQAEGDVAITDIKTKLKTAQDEAQELKSRTAEAADIKAQLKAAEAEARELKSRAEEAESHVERTKELHMTAQETSDLLQDQITRLYDDLTRRQEKLEEATSAHATLAAELHTIRSEGDGSRRDLEAQLAAATKAASSEKMGLQEERDMLKAELEQLQASLREAEMSYLPIWSHSYYSYAREAAEPALKYHREEIWTGKAYAKAKIMALGAYKQAHTAAQPHVQKAWVAIEPTFTQVYKLIKIYWDKLQAALDKEPYRSYVEKARGAGLSAYNFALGMRGRAVELWNSDEVNKAKAFVMSQKRSLERDLGNLFTHALGADVPGSGIDPSFVQNLVQFTLYAVPAFLIGFPLLCMRGGGKKKKGSAGIPTASPAHSKAKRMKKK